MPFGAALVGGGLSVLGGILGGNAASSAAKQQANAANQASAIEQSQFATTQANLQPWMKAGGNALTALQQALGIGGGGAGAFNPAGFQGSPGYQFQFQQGTDATRNAAGLSGGVNSGNTLKALTQYGQGLADQTWQQYLGNLTGLSNTGQNAAAGIGSFGAQAAGQVGANTIGAGNAQAAGTVGSANALAGGINGLSQDALLAMLLNNQGGGSGGNVGGYTNDGTGYQSGNNFTQNISGGGIASYFNPSSWLGNNN